jgi:oligopeptide/dipeptide ABC transporter ATP-binding protein
MHGSALRQSAFLDVRELTKHYDLRRGLMRAFSDKAEHLVRAVNGVNFQIKSGETLGLIGESGCGKSTLARTILQLHEPTSGEIWFDGQNVTAFDHTAMKGQRRRMQIIFQDPYASLNPRRSVEEIVGLPLRLHERLSKSQIRDRVAALIERVGLSPEHLKRYPHQFSGGQRQRIGIARALVLRPEFIICDEPVSALDVSIQAQILQLLLELKREMGLTYIFISHDLSVVAYVSNRVAVMYLGEIVEIADVKSLLAHPSHPYTQALLSALPRIDPVDRRERVRLTGDLPSPTNLPSGCKFHTRCPQAMAKCRTVAPPPIRLSDGHEVACHLYGGEG